MHRGVTGRNRKQESDDGKCENLVTVITTHIIHFSEILSDVPVVPETEGNLEEIDRFLASNLKRYADNNF